MCADYSVWLKDHQQAF
jgi:hypothetical protein